MSLKLGCKCCKFAGLKNGSYPKYEVTTKDAMQTANFEKHDRNPKHRAAAISFLTKTLEWVIDAPTKQEFESLCEAIRQGNATCKTRKMARMTWCLNEAIKSEDQKYVLNICLLMGLEVFP